jgi:predicted MFS family arabinose efflux permease
VRRVYPLAAGMFALGLDAYVLAGVLPEISGDLHSDISRTGLVVTAFTLAYALGSPVLATLTANWPRQRVLVGALLLFTLANVGSALSTSVGLLMVTRVLAGIGAGLYSPTAAATAAFLAPAHRRGRSMALVLGGLQLATVVGVPIGTYVGVRFGWRATMGLVVVVGALAALVLVLSPVRVAAPAPPPLRRRIEVLGDRAVLRWLVVMFCASIASLGLYTYLGTILRTKAHVAPGALPLFLLVWGISVVTGNVISSRALDSGRPATTLMAVTLAALAVSGGALSVTTAPGFALAVIVLFGLGCGSLQIPLQHKVLDVAGDRGALAVSLLISALYLGSAAGSALGGVVLALAGAGWLPLPAVVAALIALALSRKPDKTPRDAVPAAPPQAASRRIEHR